jgi:hypothetical protein
LFYMGMQVCCHPKRRSQTEDVWEVGADENILT